MDLNQLRNIYEGKRVFVTGHSGFKGVWLTKVLLKCGAIVFGYSNTNYLSAEDFNNIQFQSFKGDIRNQSILEAEMKKFKPHMIFHLAAQPIVTTSYQDPIDTFSTNIMGSAHLLESVRRCESVEALIYVTSDKCYHNNEWIWGYRETDRLGGKDPYSASKACAELIFSSYWDSFLQEKKNFSCASVRAGNVIGGGDWSDNRIVPDAIRAFSKGKTLILRSPHATRPWQHVLEPLSGYLHLGGTLLENRIIQSEGWNFGPSPEEVRSVLDVAKGLQGLMGQGRIKIEKQNGSLHEAGLLKLNCDKANALLGWRPRWNFENTLEKTASWYKFYLKNKNLNQIYDQQITEYFEGSND